MTNKSKAKGTRAETMVVNWLQDNGFPEAYRQVLSGGQDRGDVRLASDLPVIGEVKWKRATALAGELDKWKLELITEIGNAKADFGFLIYNRPRCFDVSRWHVLWPEGRDGLWVSTTAAEGLVAELKDRCGLR